MSKHRNRVHTLVMLTVAALAALAAGAAVAARAASPDDAIARADALRQEGRLVEARRTLVEIDRTALDADGRERLFELMTAVDRRLRYTDPVDVSLEKAAISLREGDLRNCDRHANAARRADQASATQRRRAEQLLEDSAQMKRDLAPVCESALVQAIGDFEDGRYAEAKAGFDSVYRSGVDLSTEDLRTIDRHRERIAELERERGRPFELNVVPLAFLEGDYDREALRAEMWEAANQPAPDEQEEAGDQQEQTEEAETDQPAEEVFEEAVRFDAQRTLAEADDAYQARRFGEALDKYQRVTGEYGQYLPEAAVQRARERIAEIRVQLQQPGGQLLEEEVRRGEIVREQAIAEFENLLAESRDALNAGDTERARELASEARLRLAEVRRVFAQDEFESLVERQRALLQQIITREQEITRQQVEERSEELEQQAREQQAEKDAERQQKINESLDRIRALQMEQKYEEALQVVEQVLFLDPNNPAGLLLKETLQDLMIYRDWSLTQRDKALSYARASNRVQDALVVPDSLLDYPPDWPEISFRRGAPEAFQESPEDRRVLAELRSKRIPANFADAKFEDVIQFIAQVTNLNVDVDWDSLADIGVDREDLVSLNLQPLPAEVVLERVLDKVSPDEFSRASWAANDGVLVIASESALRKNTFVVIYDIRDLLFRIQDFDEAPDLGLGEIVEGGGGGGTQSDFEVEEDEGPTEEELLDQIIEIVQTNIDPDGWADAGGDTGRINELNGNLIITNTARNHRQIAGLLSQLREIRAIQINVDARFLLVRENFFEEIGFDLDVIFNVNEQFSDALGDQAQFPLARSDPGTGGSRTLLPSDLIGPFFADGSRVTGSPEFVVQNFEELADGTDDIPEIGLGLPMGQTADVPAVVTRPDSLSMVPTQQNSLGLARELLDASQFASNIGMANPALGVAATFLDDIQVDLLLEATQADRRAVTLTAPRVTFTNGNAATISVLTEEGFISDLDITVGTGGIGVEPEIGRVASGFVMVVDGVVSADRRYVTMEIQAQLSERTDFQEFVGATAQAAGIGQGAGGTGDVIERDIQLPVLQTTEIRTGATVPDQGTILLGGQRLADEVEIETGVPVLSKVPVINRFFTNRIEDRQEQTLLILVKPTILIQSEEEEKNFPGLLDSLENRFGAGF